MSEKNIGYFVHNFFKGSDFESFYFIERSELDELFENYQSEISKACCSRKRKVNHKYEQIIRSKF